MEFLSKAEDQEKLGVSKAEDQEKLDVSHKAESPKEVSENPNAYCLDCVPIDEKEVPPVERVILPRDVADINDDDESVYIIGTKDGKVTMIDGLDHMKKLKVSYRVFLLEIQLLNFASSITR